MNDSKNFDPAAEFLPADAPAVEVEEKLPTQRQRPADWEAYPVEILDLILDP